MSLAMMVLAAAPLALPENGAVRWRFSMAEPVQSTGCNGNHFGFDDNDVARFTKAEIVISRKAGEVDEVRLATPDCYSELPAATTLPDISVAESLALLATAAATDDLSRNDAEHLFAAIAWHDGQEAVELLEKYSRHAEERRWKPATFWLARSGTRGREFVTGFLASGHSQDRRKHALIVLALQDDEGFLDPIRQSALTDPSAEVRAEALFALSLADAPGAAAFIETICRSDSSNVVRERAIFALSQLENAAAVDALIRMVRDVEFGEHRRTALFWLAQMDEEKASDLVARMAASL